MHVDTQKVVTEMLQNVANQGIQQDSKIMSSKEYYKMQKEAAKLTETAETELKKYTKNTRRRVIAAKVAMMNKQRLIRPEIKTERLPMTFRADKQTHTMLQQMAVAFNLRPDQAVAQCIRAAYDIYIEALTTAAHESKPQEVKDESGSSEVAS